MTNTTAIALFALIGLLVLTIWRIHTGRVNDKYKTAWAAGVMAVLVAVATDLNSDLGAAIAFAVLVGLLGRSLGTASGATGPVSGAIGSSSGPLGPTVPIPQIPPGGATTPGGIPIPSAPAPAGMSAGGNA
jgi:hypothetical protein